MKDEEEGGLPDHKKCKGVLVKEWVGQNKVQIRCSYCKKVLTRAELNSHGLSEYYSEEDEQIKAEEEDKWDSKMYSTF